MAAESLSSTSLMSTRSTASSMQQQPRPPGGPKPTFQRFGRSINKAGKVVRSPYLVTSTPYSSKKPKLPTSSLPLKNGVGGRCNGGGGGSGGGGGGRSNDGGGGGGGSDGGGDGAGSILRMPTQPKYIPHPSMSAFLQSLMKTPAFSAVVNPSGSKRSHPATGYATSHRQYRWQSITNAGTNSVAAKSGDLDAIQLRDELMKMRKEMNLIVKERDFAEAQQAKLSKDILRKDFEIEGLLKSGHIEETTTVVESFSSVEGEVQISSWEFQRTKQNKKIKLHEEFSLLRSCSRFRGAVLVPKKLLPVQRWLLLILYQTICSLIGEVFCPTITRSLKEAVADPTWIQSQLQQDVTRDATRSLTKLAHSKAQSTYTSMATSSGSIHLVSSLKLKVHGLERVLRETKEQVIGLKRSVGSTQISEMQLQAHVYQREISRLNHLLNMNSVENDTVDSGCSLCTVREAHIKLLALNQTTMKMAAQLKSIKEENRNLQKKLEVSLSVNKSCTRYPDANEAGLRGSLIDNHLDDNKEQMLSAIVDLELQCHELEGSIRSFIEEKNQVRVQHEQEVLDLKEQLSESNNAISKIQHELAASRVTESKMKSVIRGLKDDRVHYRKSSELTQNELCGIKESLEKEEMTKATTMKELLSLQEKHKNEMIAFEHARGLSKKSSCVFTPSREKKEKAAKTIQRNWKRTKSIRRQEKYQRETEETIIYIQSVFQGHMVRKQVLNSSQCDHGLSLKLCDSMKNVEDESDIYGSSDAIVLVQSVMRGFLTRQMTLQDLKRGTSHLEDGGLLQSSSDTDTPFNQISSLSGYTSPLAPPYDDLKQNISMLKLTTNISTKFF